MPTILEHQPVLNLRPTRLPHSPLTHLPSPPSWKNRDDIDFQSAEDVQPTQEVELPHDPTGELQIPLKSFLFSNVSNLSLLFTGSNGGKQTKIQYIGLRGRGSQVSLVFVIF